MWKGRHTVFEPEDDVEYIEDGSIDIDGRTTGKVMALLQLDEEDRSRCCFLCVYFT